MGGGGEQVFLIFFIKLHGFSFSAESVQASSFLIQGNAAKDFISRYCHYGMRNFSPGKVDRKISFL